MKTYLSTDKAVEAWQQFLTKDDVDELIEQAHKDAKRIRADNNFGTEREGTDR